MKDAMKTMQSKIKRLQERADKYEKTKVNIYSIPSQGLPIKKIILFCKREREKKNIIIRINYPSFKLARTTFKSCFFIYYSYVSNEDLLYFFQDAGLIIPDSKTFIEENDYFLGVKSAFIHNMPMQRTIKSELKGIIDPREIE